MDDNIQFIQNHQPALKGGEYSLNVTLEVKNLGDTPDSKQNIDRGFTVSGCFTVSGERFALKPTDIQAVFPPAGSLGDHSNVLPHIILNRSTLPWERVAVSSRNEVPWLALLLFEEQEAPKPQILTLKLDESQKLHESQLITLEPPEKSDPEATHGRFPPVYAEAGQHAGDQVTVIDVPAGLLQSILPKGEALKYLAHVRKGTDLQEFAVIIGNRLPKRGGMSIVHLVSLEGRYDDTGEFDYQDAKADELIRLVSLYTWRFACEDEQQSFKHLLLNLITGARTLRLPENANADAEKYLAMGCVPLPHSTRQAMKTISWVHGPLLPGKNVTEEADVPRLPVRDSDQLLRFNPSLALFDVSYAAAWELGRFMALQSKTFSTALFNWKRSHIQKLQQANLTHLPVRGPNPSLEQPPSTILTWLEHLERLEGVPFNYLVPDERTLRPESIRFFYLDWLWLECLQDGAFSIGRVTEADERRDVTLKHDLDTALETYEEPKGTVTDRHLSKASRPITGFLLRSEVVAGWPGLLVDGYLRDSDMSRKPLRMDRLSKNILFCLFDGELAAIDIYLKPETMHFGVSEDSADPTKFTKDLRKTDGSPSPTRPIEVQVDASRIIKIGDLAAKMNISNSAEFAFQMIEGVEKVRFKLTV